MKKKLLPILFLWSLPLSAKKLTMELQPYLVGQTGGLFGAFELGRAKAFPNQLTYLTGGLGAQYLEKYDNDEDETVNYYLYSELKHYLPLFSLQDEEDVMGRITDFLGLVLGVRGYFVPTLPRTYTYQDNSDPTIASPTFTYIGAYRSQFGYGMSLGIYISHGRSHLALKYEYNTMDAFEELRKVYDEHNPHGSIP